MKVKREILEKIDNPRSRTRIALRLGCGEQNVANLIRKNFDNGALTKMIALKAISEETGLSLDEILEETGKDTTSVQ